jgi:hypothetical protein
MKIAVVSESPADEAAIKILVDAIIGTESELFPLRTRPQGWTKIFDLLPNILSGLHYGRPDVEGLVIVIDSDDSVPHRKAHEEPNQSASECRLCQLRSNVTTITNNLRPLTARPALKIGLGLAVPAIEAWYQAGVDSHVNEVAWIRKLSGEDVTYDCRSLKRSTYGSYQPSLEMETIAAIAAAHRLTQNLSVLEELFPDGFGSLLRDLRNWGD